MRGGCLGDNFSGVAAWLLLRAILVGLAVLVFRVAVDVEGQSSLGMVMFVYLAVQTVALAGAIGLIAYFAGRRLVDRDFGARWGLIVFDVGVLWTFVGIEVATRVPAVVVSEDGWMWLMGAVYWGGYVLSFGLMCRAIRRRRV